MRIRAEFEREHNVSYADRNCAVKRGKQTIELLTPRIPGVYRVRCDIDASSWGWICVTDTQSSRNTTGTTEAELLSKYTPEQATDAHAGLGRLLDRFEAMKKGGAEGRDALAYFEEQKAVIWISRLLSDTAQREVGLECLGRIGSRNAVEPIIEAIERTLMEEEREEGRREDRVARWRFQSKCIVVLESVVGREMLDEGSIYERLSGKDPARRESAVKALKAFISDVRTPPRAKTMTDPKPPGESSNMKPDEEKR